VAETNNPDVGPSDRADVSPSADGRALRWAGQRTRRRDEFVSAAVEAIRLHGPDVTVEAIAQSAGVARTRIYRHFRDGAEIRVAVAARIADMLMTVLAPSSNTDGMPHIVFTDGARRYVDWLSANRNLWAYLVQDPLLFNGFRTGMVSALASLFSPYLTAVGADPDTARRLAAAVVGMGSSLVDEWNAAPSASDSTTLVEDISEWSWALINATLNRYGRSLDPGQPLPTVSDFLMQASPGDRTDNRGPVRRRRRS
jgi:AcrR family transcriptional regulator